MYSGEKMTDKEIVKGDLESIYLGNLFTVESDLVLPLKGRLGSDISWASGFTHIVSAEGKVTRPRTGTGSRRVTLTATATAGKELMSRNFEVTVLEQPSRLVITGVVPVCETIKAGSEYHLPGIVIIAKEGGVFGTAPVVWLDEPDFSRLNPGVYEISGEALAANLVPSARVTVTEEPLANDPEEVQVKAFEFNLDEVCLLPGILDHKRRSLEEFLLGCDDDQMLYNFRSAAGLSTKGAAPMSGWDSPECLLRGHTTGHYLSAIALCSVGSRENKEKFKKKIDYMTEALEECQNAFEAGGKAAPGFLSGYSEEQFDKLEQFEVYPKIWAPYYTLHKIIAGLLDCYEFGGSERALRIAAKLGTWVYNRLSRLDSAQRAKMWAMYIAGEFGGMNEALARLYKFVPKQVYLEASKFFDNEKLFLPMSKNVDTLCDIHANQHVPQIIGAMEIYRRTGESKYLHIARNFWNFVTGSHCYNIGGAGEGEMFKEPGFIAAYLTEKTAESCVSYNMLKLTRLLFQYEPLGSYMDYYEKTLLNHIASSGGQCGGSTYFMPLLPGGKKEFDDKENSCCHGTGLENHVKYQDSIYFKNGGTLYVNLYIASALEWREKKLTIIQSGDFLKGERAAFDIKGEGSVDLRLRLPAWLRENARVSLNGKEIGFSTLDGYAVIQRRFIDGDRLEISLPFALRLERTGDNPLIGCLYYGPLVMVIDDASHDFIELDLDENAAGFEKTGDIEFTLGAYRFIPILLANTRPYHAYFKLKS